MAEYKIELNAETDRRLLKAALAARRSASRQAEVILMKALGVPVPGDDSECRQAANGNAESEARYAPAS